MNGGTRSFGFLRLVLAACVVFQHNQSLAFGVQLGTPLRPFEIGSLAVLAFFVISGIIVVAAAERFYLEAPLRFLGNRIMRIFPGYAAILLLSALVLAPFAALGILTDHEGHPAAAYSTSLLNLAENLLYALPLLNTLLPPSYSFLEIVWAVRTEFLFYCVIFAALVLAFVLRHGPLAGWLDSRLRPDPGVLFRGVLGGLFALALALYAANTWHPFVPFDSIRFVPTFALGATLGYALRGSRRAAAASLVFYLLTLREILIQPLWHPTAGFARDLPGEALLFSAMLGLVILSARRRLVPDALDRFGADTSYPIYVGHLLPIIILCSLGALDHPSPLWLLPSLGGAVVIVALIDKLVEIPMLAVRARIRHAGIDPLPPAAVAPLHPAVTAAPAAPVGAGRALGPAMVP